MAMSHQLSLRVDDSLLQSILKRLAELRRQGKPASAADAVRDLIEQGAKRAPETEQNDDAE